MRLSHGITVLGSHRHRGDWSQVASHLSSGHPSSDHDVNSRTAAPSETRHGSSHYTGAAAVYTLTLLLCFYHGFYTL